MLSLNTFKKLSGIFEFLFPVRYNGLELEELDKEVNVLIAEDENAIVDMLQKVIKSDTSNVSSASTISSAISEMPKHDILILDLSLNGMPNAGRVIYDQWSRVKHNHPCIIITGDVSDADITYFIRAGVLYVHKKPFDMHMFYSTYKHAHKQIMNNTTIETQNRNIKILRSELKRIDAACLQRQRKLSAVIFAIFIILILISKQNIVDIFSALIGVG